MNYTDEELATLAYNHKLFVRDWQMAKLYEYIHEGNLQLGIHLIIENNIPIASCVIDLEEGIVNVFVKEEYRGKRYGLKVVEETLAKYKIDISEVYGAEGIEGSESFYNKCCLAYFKTGYLSMSKEEAKLYINNQLAMIDIRKSRVADYWEKHKTASVKLKL